MTETIYKYVLCDAGFYGETSIEHYPEGAMPRAVARQGSKLCLWAQINPQENSKKTWFRIVGTGQEISEDWAYIGTLFDGPYVWHVFQDFGIKQI